MFNDNRITKYAQRVIQPKLDAATPEQLTSVAESMKVSFEDHVGYQSLQSRAFAMGLIPLEEAQTVYASLGEVPHGDNGNGGWNPSVSLAMQVAITKYLGELAGKVARA